MKAIGYDIDDVLTQTSKLALRMLNDKLGTNYTIADYTLPSIEESFDLTSEVVNKVFADEGNYGFPHDVLPIEGAIRTINKYHFSVKQYFITARNNNLGPGTIKWFNQNGILYAPRRVILGGGSGRTPEYDALKKAENAKKLGLELFVEDRLLNANVIAEESGIPVCLLELDYQFNKGPTHPLVKRVINWDDIEDTIEEILNPLQ